MTDVLNSSELAPTFSNGSLVNGQLRPIIAFARDIEKLDCNAPWRRLNLALKRLIDSVGAAVALAVFSPILLLAALAIKLESKGPVFFVQDRWGKGHRTFKVLKFRSMYTDACDLTGIAQTVKGDARITRVGAFLRKTNIDELPQLINVLKGDMSLVGPRCHVMGMQAAGMDYEKLVPQYHLRHTMRPGITGLAQMRGLRGPTTDARRAIRRVRSDLEYIVTFNVMLDIKILILTVWNEVFKGGRGF